MGGMYIRRLEGRAEKMEERREKGAACWRARGKQPPGVPGAIRGLVERGRRRPSRRNLSWGRVKQTDPPPPQPGNIDLGSARRSRDPVPWAGEGLDPERADGELEAALLRGTLPPGEPAGPYSRVSARVIRPHGKKEKRKTAEQFGR